jgi:DNA adenine methylase
MVIKTESTKLKPFIKYAGGKRWLAPTLAPGMLPKEFGNYYEPFLGGGAMYWHMLDSGLLTGKNVYLGDNNPLLVMCFLAVRDDYNEIRSLLLEMKNTREDFYKYREELNKCMHELDQEAIRTHSRAWFAARVMYINKFGYNGLLRMNKKGEINTPYGNQPNAKFNQDLLSRCSLALAGKNNKAARASILCTGFDDTLNDAKSGDLVYLDPPYVPSSKTSNFTSYTEEGFGKDSHVALAKTFTELASKGVYAIMSNSDTSLTRELYKGFRAFQVQSRRAINSVASKREPVSELVIFSWGEPTNGR